MSWLRDVRDELRHHSLQNTRIIGLLKDLNVATAAEQASFDAFAEAVTAEAGDIGNAVAVVSSEISKLRQALEAAGGTALDTTKADAALAALTGSVDTLQTVVPGPVEETPETPVVEEPAEEPLAPVAPEIPSVDDVPEGELVNENLR